MGIARPSITFFGATTGRKTLTNILRSLYGQFDHGNDRIELFFDGPTFTEVGPDYFQPEQELYGEDLIIHLLPENLGCWGHSIRNKFQGTFHTDYISNFDDDDVYAENCMLQVRQDIKENFGKLLMYKFRNCDGIQWREPVIKHGNVGTPTGLIPNDPSILGTWGEFAGGDAYFYETTRDKIGNNNIVWKDFLIYKTRPHVYGP